MAILALRNRKNSSPESIAAGVEKPAQLVAAETERAALEERRASFRKDIASANEGFWRFGSGGERLGNLVAEESALNAAVESNRRALLAARREHAADVAGVLQPSKEAAARQLLAALADAEAAFDALAATERAVATAECRAAYPIRRPDVAHVVAQCHKIIGAPAKAPGR